MPPVRTATVARPEPCRLSTHVLSTRLCAGRQRRRSRWSWGRVTGGGREHRHHLGVVAGRDAPLADHPVDDHVLEAVDGLLEAVAQAAAGEGRRGEPGLDALDDLDVLAVDAVPEAHDLVD